MQERMFPPHDIEFKHEDTIEFVEEKVRDAIKLRYYYSGVYDVKLPHDILIVGPNYFIKSWIDSKNNDLCYSYGKIGKNISLEHLMDALEFEGIQRSESILFIGDHRTWQSLPDTPAVIRISDDYSIHGYQFKEYPPQVFHVFNAEYIDVNK